MAYLILVQILVEKMMKSYLREGDVINVCEGLLQIQKLLQFIYKYFVSIS